MRIFTTYTDNIIALDTRFKELDKATKSTGEIRSMHVGDVGNITYAAGKFATKSCFTLHTRKNGNHGVCVITCLDRYYDDFLVPLANDGLLEFLGCEDEGCDHGCREKPSVHFSQDDWDKIYLAAPECEGADFFFGDLIQ